MTNTDHLTLLMGSKNYSSWSVRPWLVLKHFGIPFEERLVDFTTPEGEREIAEFSPSGKVPVLTHGENRVWDSLAICEYLAELFPKWALWPKDQAARAQARSACAEMHSGFLALRNELPMNLKAEKPNRPRSAEAKADIERVVDLWQEIRAWHGKGGPFLFGEFTIADAFYAPVVARFRSYGVKLEGPALEYSNAIWALPAMQELLRDARAEKISIPEYE